MLQVEKRIRSRVKRQMEKTQREYYLNEQMKAIQKELGDDETVATNWPNWKKRIAKTKLSKEAREKAEAELKKLRQMSPMSAEATVVRNYLDWLLSPSLGQEDRRSRSTSTAEKDPRRGSLSASTRSRNASSSTSRCRRANKLKGPILCLVGPPGVGKTSLGKSIAKATGREFVRMALGGVRDEAEIRGHRRTYIGSMPGKIIQSMKKAKNLQSALPAGRDRQDGQWTSAAIRHRLCLRCWIRNRTHVHGDHYLEVDYDLSNVMFVTTANTLNIPAPLMDRMEIIRIAGYTEDEKLEIAKRHLLPKAIKDHALRPEGVLRGRRRRSWRSSAVHPRSGRPSFERELIEAGP